MKAEMTSIQKKGESLYRGGDYSGAVACFRQLVENDPNYILGYLWLSDCHREIRDYHSALEDIAAALKIDPADKSFPDDGLYKTRGQLCLYKGDILEAVKAFQESIVHHPFADVVPFNYLQATYEAVGWKDESEVVGKLKQKMRSLVLTEEHRRRVYELCEACNRNSLEKSLWKVHDLKRVCGAV